MTKQEIDGLLERFDQAEPALQRQIIAKLADLAGRCQTLARLGRSMRKAQGVYFQNRTSKSLGEARNWEQHFDAAVKEIIDPPQPDLFSTTPDKKEGA